MELVFLNHRTPNIFQTTKIKHPWRIIDSTWIHNRWWWWQRKKTSLNTCQSRKPCKKKRNFGYQPQVGLPDANVAINHKKFTPFSKNDTVQLLVWGPLVWGPRIRVPLSNGVPFRRWSKGISSARGHKRWVTAARYKWSEFSPPG